MSRWKLYLYRFCIKFARVELKFCVQHILWSQIGSLAGHFVRGYPANGFCPNNNSRGDVGWEQSCLWQLRKEPSRGWVLTTEYRAPIRSGTIMRYYSNRHYKATYMSASFALHWANIQPFDGIWTDISIACFCNVYCGWFEMAINKCCL